MASDARRAPRHHLDLAVSFAEPSSLLLAGWAVRPDDLAELELLSTASGLDARALACRWYERADVKKEVPGGLAFCAIVELSPERISGPLYLAFRLADGTRLLGTKVEPGGCHAEIRRHVTNLLATQRGLVSPELVMQAPRRMELLSCVAAPPREFAERVAMCIDQHLTLGDGSSVVSGWCYAEHGLTSFEVLNARGERLCDVLSDGVFFRRQDVTERLEGRSGANRDLGLAFRIPAPASPGEGARPLFLCARSKDDELFGLELSAAALEPTLEGSIRSLLRVAPPSSSSEDALVERCLGPALLSLKRSFRPEPRLRERAYGPLREQAPFAVVISDPEPNWLRYQLAQLGQNAETAECDIVYVLRDPAEEAALLGAAEELHEHFGVAFRLLISGEQVPAAAAVNAAVLRTQGDHLLLLDAKVLPRGPFVRRLRDAFTHSPEAGAVGPLLVSAEGTVARPPAIPSGHARDLPAPSLPEALVDLRGPVPVDALRTACLFTERARFLAAGGLSQEYFTPEIAEIELSARLKERGRLYVVPEVALDHLGSPAPHSDGADQRRLDHYDRWLWHGRRARPNLEGAACES